MEGNLHRYVVPLPLAAAQRRWHDAAEPWMSPVEFEAAGAGQTVLTVPVPQDASEGFDIAYRTAIRVEEFVARTRRHGSCRPRRGEVLPPFGAAAGPADV